MESPLKDIQIPDVLKTDRLDLRLSTLDMAKDFNAAIHASAKEFLPWFQWCHPELPTMENTVSHALTNLKEQREKEAFHFGIYLKDTETLVGRISLDKLDPAVPSFVIGYWTHSHHAGNGYMSEAVDAFLDFSINTLKSARLSIRHDVENKASGAIIEKMVSKWGFEKIGIFKNEYRRKFDGKLGHTVEYSFTQDVE